MFVTNAGSETCIHKWVFEHNAQHCVICDRIEKYYLN